MKYASTTDFMQGLFEGTLTRGSIVEQLFGHSDIAAIAAEHGADRDRLLRAIGANEESPAGARLRKAVEVMRSTGVAPAGHAFPAQLDRASDGALELIGLFVNPLMTTAMILGAPPPSLEDAGRAIDPNLSLARYASRVFRVLAVQHPELERQLTNAAAALEAA
jgi:hypothetical protein